MRAVIQRVSRASVRVDEVLVGQIDLGLVVLLGVSHSDTLADAVQMAEKVAQLRIFSDEDGKMNLSVQDVGGAVLAVSQFTLFGDCRKGRRPSYTEAARPDIAEELYEAFVKRLGSLEITVQTGVFGAMMEVDLVNDGPVTLLIDSTKLF